MLLVFHLLHHQDTYHTNPKDRELHASISNMYAIIFESMRKGIGASTNVAEKLCYKLDKTSKIFISSISGKSS